MHQDQRIGLALGVLLVGACAAFFFRNEARSVTPVPRLQHAQELDDRIAERSTRPYLKGIEAVEAGDRRRSRTSQDQESPDCDHTPAEWSPLDPPGSDLFTGNSQNRKPRARLLDDGEVQELAPIAIPSDNRVATENAGPNPTDVTTRRPNPKTTASEAKTHVVQKGETLSSIAARTLGSANRFHELYEANQDQLHDPNDLKLGMILRIPDLRHGSISKPPSSNTNSVSEQTAVNVEQPQVRDSLDEAVPPVFEIRIPETRTEAQDPPSILIPAALPSDIPIDAPVEGGSADEFVTNPTKKFVPSRRTPPPARPAGPQAKNSQSRETGGRKLSQASLESTSGKVAR